MSKTPATKLSKTIIDCIDSLPDDGEWWKKRSRQEFISAAELMSKAGMKDASICGILVNLYSACASEFGN